MSASGDWSEAVERLRAAIVARFGTLAAFARQVPMESTQLSATLKPHRRPEPETLDRFSAALGWEPSQLREWYGYAIGNDNGDGDGEEPPPVRPDGDYSPAEIERIIAWVKDIPDEDVRAQIAEEEAALPREDFVESVLLLHAAWMSNFKLGFRPRRRGVRNGARA